MNTTISCTYRIYPSWFGGEGVARPMRELAERSAANMARKVQSIEQVGSGFDHCGGHFQDYMVTYSEIEQKMEVRH